MPSRKIEYIHGLYSLTFDDAFDLIKAKYLLRLCDSQTIHSCCLLAHFVEEHNFGIPCAKRLIKAFVKSQDSKTTNVFNDEEDIFNHGRRIICPFHGRRSNPLEC